MKKMLVLPRFDASGAAPRYRVYQYFNSFINMGYKIIDKPLLDKTYLDNLYFAKRRSFTYLLKMYLKRGLYLLFNKSKYDVVLMDGELFPFIPYFIEKFFLPKKYVIDQDDAIFHTYDNHRLTLVRKLLGNKIGKIWSQSEHIIVGNSYVKEKARELGAKNISVLPTVVDAEKYRPLKISQAKPEIILGWVGSPCTVHSLKLIESVLTKISKKFNIHLYVIGADYRHPSIKTTCFDWKNGWSELDEIKLTNEIDIGIMPLQDGPYEKGKCGFKLIKYMSCAKPMIASAVGMNNDIVDHDVNGYLATSLEDWEKYLLLLITDKTKREEFGNKGREKMLSEYSLQVTAPMFCDIIKKVVSQASYSH